ncbi:PAS domain-containing protein [Halonotius terrestris]|uniref:histidine kinase n=1 Tax=Halonotius terrestris TaxID=2487750 RepID=A0A8J8PDI5_9EURY|nr:ATP-binding protein [Halonotius terrestris]TQQ83391.1 PAS domain-containing protein [Halonotius terrestris]
MSSRQERIQTLYEISLSIGPKETLEETAEEALSGYLQKLNCSVGGIYRRREDGSYEPTATVPAEPTASDLLSTAANSLNAIDTAGGIDEALPMTGATASDEHYYLFELPEFGVLVLGKRTGELDAVTRSALASLNEKLAEACNSKLVERQLRKEHNRFGAVFDAIPEPVANTVVEDGTERIVACNKPFKRTFGTPDRTPGEDLLGELTPTEAAVGDRRPTAGEGQNRYVTTETTCPTREGSGEFLFHSVPVETDHEAEYIQLYVDISDQKERERELERYERLVENLPIGVYQTTPGADGEFRLVNQGLVDILEADSKAFFDDHTVSDIYVDPAEREAFSDQLLAEGEVDSVELQLETAAGNPMWAEISGIASEERDETVFELALQDITARKERDQQLSVLNRVLRHNLRNAINVIEGNAALLDEEVEREDLQACVNGIEQRVKNLSQLSEKAVTVRSLFDQGREINTACDVRTLLETVADEFEDRHPEASFTVDDFEPMYVRADVRLKMALTELVSNAIVHNDQSTPTVTVTAGPSETGRAGEWVDIEITDNGPGIPPHERKTIESGDETPLQHGTGLGLWLVYWAISLLGGDITIDEAEAGTRITLTLPRVTVDAADEASGDDNDEMLVGDVGTELTEDE